jgi:NAD(P)-dependent dehydrogenase (short-subunit alcohol dehydrogenase family)
VVTGANKGIGKEIVRQLAAQGVGKVVATARDPQLGTAAAADVSTDVGVEVVFHQVSRPGQVGEGSCGETAHSRLNEVAVFLQLDLDSEASVKRFATWLEATFPGGVDVLVTNAGMAYKARAPSPSSLCC